MFTNKKDRVKRFEPGYQKLYATGALREKGEQLWAMMARCELCPHRCGANRLQGERGWCGADDRLEIASYHLHFGEEDALVGHGGSGTIFMTHCSMQCVFCINWEISRGAGGMTYSIDQLAAIMLGLQQSGCSNINIVTPTHYSPHLILALDQAASQGLRIPLVYNTSGWERIEILKILDGVVDIYLTDFKFIHSKAAATYAFRTASYPGVAREALLEMQRQVGTARPASDGLLYKGLMIRHLVMPNEVSGTHPILEWIATHLPLDTYINLMSQYRPVYQAWDFPELTRTISRSEYESAIAYARQLKLTNLHTQGFYG